MEAEVKLVSRRGPFKDKARCLRNLQNRQTKRAARMPKPRNRTRLMKVHSIVSSSEPKMPLPVCVPKCGASAAFAFSGPSWIPFVRPIASRTAPTDLAASDEDKVRISVFLLSSLLVVSSSCCLLLLLSDCLMCGFVLRSTPLFLISLWTMEEDDEQRQEIEREFRTLEQDVTAFSQRLPLFLFSLSQQTRTKRNTETNKRPLKKRRATLQRPR